ncbi:MAG: hypothetical protein KBD24_03065 [Candidatus Pacebacteria bacterium]|nr:hypothetical protein [Candidatus Paceibacterota bacterium]
MEEEKQNITNNVIPAEGKKPAFSPIILVTLVGAVVVLAVVFGMQASKNNESAKNTEDLAKLTLVIDKSEFMIGDMGQVRVMLDADGDGPEVATDVTAGSSLSSENTTVAEVADIVELKGQLLTHAEGTASLVAVYEGRTARTDVVVQNPKLDIFCEGNPATPKVGEVVNWLLVLKEKGVPNYSYSWTGTDGLVAEEAYHAISYDTEGRKDASIDVVDVAGNTAHADCFVTVVK